MGRAPASRANCLPCRAASASISRAWTACSRSTLGLTVANAAAEPMHTGTRARKSAPGHDAFATDACVPISRLAQAIAEARELAAAAGLVAPIVGHVGDGNFHMLLLHDPASPQQREAAEQLSADIAHLAIRLGGTATGEHGIGLHKRHAMTAEHDQTALHTMAAIKKSLDPHNILNPGKIIPNLD